MPVNLPFPYPTSDSGEWDPYALMENLKFLAISTLVKRDTDGNVIIVSLPTSDPHVVGALYNSSGTLKVSAG